MRMICNSQTPSCLTRCGLPRPPCPIHPSKLSFHAAAVKLRELDVKLETRCDVTGLSGHIATSPALSSAAFWYREARISSVCGNIPEPGVYSAV